MYIAQPPGGPIIDLNENPIEPSLDDSNQNVNTIQTQNINITQTQNVVQPVNPLLPGSFNLVQDSKLFPQFTSTSYTFVGIGFLSMVSGGTPPYNYLLTDLKYAEVDANGNVGTFTPVTPVAGVPPSNFISSANASVNAGGVPITYQQYYWQTTGVSTQTLRFEMTVTDSSPTPNSITFTEDIILINA